MHSARKYALPLALISSACSIQARCGLDHCLTNSGDARPTEDAGGPSGPDGDTKDVENARYARTKMVSVPVAVEPGRPTARSFVAKIAAGASCPVAPMGWVLEPAPVIASTRVAALMARYCAYELARGAVVRSDLPALAAPAGVIERVVADYAQVLPQALIRGTGAGNHARLREELGASFKDGASNVDAPTRPYVAIVDTAETEAAWPGMPREQHGLAMGGIVSTIRCPADEASCDHKRILYAQAFPSSLSSSGDDVEARGSVWSLNLAVLDALERWRSLSGGKVPLVLNMSVGWEWGFEDTEILAARRKGLLEGHEGAMHSKLSPAEEALFLTLSWASCQQVLAIAATGNTPGGACEQTGPMAPAAWESLTPLDWNECRALLDPADHDQMPPEPDHRPNALVYAAGGIDADDQPIVNARPRSEPKRVLYASMASVPTSDADYTAPWTGTSVAAASLSAIAAQYWGFGGNLALQPAEVIAAIDGHSTPIAAGCVSVPSSTPVPRVRAYQALPDLYEQSSVSIGLPDDMDASFDAPDQPFMTLASNPTDNRTCNGRAITVFSFAGAATATGDAWPELTPQPNSPICPACPLTLSGTQGASLHIALDRTTYNPQTVGTTAVLELHLPQGNVTRIDLDLSNHCTLVQPCTLGLAVYSHPNNAPNQTLSDYIMTANVRSARLSFYVPTGPNGTQLVGNEIDVFHK